MARTRPRRARPSADELREARLRHDASEIGEWLAELSDVQVRVLAHRLLWLLRATHRGAMDGDLDGVSAVDQIANLWVLTTALLYACCADEVVTQHEADEARVLREILDHIRALIPDH